MKKIFIIAALLTLIAVPCSAYNSNRFGVTISSVNNVQHYDCSNWSVSDKSGVVKIEIDADHIMLISPEFYSTVEVVGH